MFRKCQNDVVCGCGCGEDKRMKGEGAERAGERSG